MIIFDDHLFVLKKKKNDASDRELLYMFGKSKGKITMQVV